MTQAVLCPQCGKKFGLPERPPATFTCTQCGTLMDLSAFGGAERPAPPSTRSAPAAATPRAGPRRPRGGSRRGRGPLPPQGASPRRSSSNGTQVVLAIVGVFILVLVIIVATKGGDDRAPRRDADDSVSIVKDAPTWEPPVQPKRKADDDTTERAPKRRTIPRNRNGTLRVSGIELLVHPWLDEVDHGTRPKVEEAIRKMYVGGRDGVEAREWLVSQGRPICGRLISEFKTLAESPGYDDREGTSMAAVIDGTLRSIDGVLERTLGERERIRAWGAFASPRFVTKIAKCWTWWWTSGEWRDNPLAPWDPHEDESDDAADGIKRPEPKKKGGGYKKRAGSD